MVTCLVTRIPDMAAKLLTFEPQLWPFSFPNALTVGDLYADRMAMRPNVTCKGSSSSSQSHFPFATASFGFSGRLGIP